MSFNQIPSYYHNFSEADVAALNGRPKAASDSVQLGHHGESGAGEGVRGGPRIQLQQLLPGILVRRPRLPQGPVRFGRVLPLPRPGDLLRRVQRLHSHPCTVTLALPGWNSLDVCMYVFIATALTGGCNAPMGGAVGWLLNGVSLFGWSDAQSYQDKGVWVRRSFTRIDRLRSIVTVPLPLAAQPGGRIRAHGLRPLPRPRCQLQVSS